MHVSVIGRKTFYGLFQMTCKSTSQADCISVLAETTLRVEHVALDRNDAPFIAALDLAKTYFPDTIKGMIHRLICP